LLLFGCINVRKVSAARPALLYQQPSQDKYALLRYVDTRKFRCFVDNRGGNIHCGNVIGSLYFDSNDSNMDAVHTGTELIELTGLGNKVLAIVAIM